MAVLGRVLFSSAERIDLSDLLSIESYAAGDLKYLLQSFVGNTTPYILKGFDVINPGGCIGQQECTIRVADSVVYYPSSSAGSFFYGLPEGNALSLPLSPDLKSDSTNYIYLTLSTVNQASDARVFWDPDKNSGEGGEFSQEVNTESVLTIVLNTSVSTFPEGTIPIAKIITIGNNIDRIVDCRDLFFRLGTGGANANPYANFAYRSLPTAPLARSEPPITMVEGRDPNPFQGGDKNIYTLKEWMDAVMSQLKELGGGPFWYGSSSSISTASIFKDTLGSTLKSKGTWEHDGTTPGLVTWTADLIYKSLQDPQDIIIRAGDAQLDNEQVAFIELVRVADINGGPVAVDFNNDFDFINGPPNSFQNLSIGDWIRKKSDTDDKFLRVEQFYDAINKGGSTTITAATARSIGLSGKYAGSTATTEAVYTKGVYKPADVQVVDRNAADLTAAGGNLFWLVARSDIKMAISSVTESLITGTITSNDGVIATVYSVSHGLADGDRITLTGVLTGTYVVSIIDVDYFTIEVTSSETGAISGSYALITTTKRYNGAYSSLELEDEFHHFESNETVLFLDPTETSSEAAQVNYRSSTVFQIPTTYPFTPDNTWTVSSVRVNVRKAFGAMRIVQGESIDIGEADGENIQSFIGMSSLAETHPAYFLPGGYNTIPGQENFNGDSDDNLTERVSKLTAMMADRVQDRGTLLRGRVTIRNTTNGANQDITASNTITVDKPKSPSQVLTLTCSIPANSVGVTTIGRNSSSALTITVESLNSNLLLDENKLILFYRLSGTTVYGWDGNPIAANGTHTIGATEHTQNKNISVFYPADITLNLDSLSVDYNKITFTETTADVTISIPGSTNYNTIDTSAVNNFVVNDGYAVWVRINRLAAKTINTLQTSDVADSDANGALYVTARSAVPVEQDVVVIFERIGDTLLGLHTPALLKNNIYEEVIEVVTTPVGEHEIGAVPSGTLISIPSDSRDSDTAQFYVYGSGQLEVSLNGQRLYEGFDWNEVTGSPTPSLANQIEILQDLVVGDLLVFRIATPGSVHFANVAGVNNTMQETYNTGRFIVANAGQPVDISGTPGDIVLNIQGDQNVDGTLFVQDDVMPTGDGTSDLGSVSHRFNDVYAANGTIQTSDRRFKEDIVDSDLGLTFIKRLRPVSFKWVGRNRTHYGLIAQEVETTLRDKDAAVLIKSPVGANDNQYGLRYNELIAPLIKAIQEQQEMIEAMKAEIELLKNK